MKSVEQTIEKIGYIFLPPAFIAKGYITGRGAPNCNYEEYLAELLDKSTYFRQRTKGRPIKLIEKQDNGQPDISENGFELDFKLIGGQSAITAQKLTSQSITHFSDGAVAYGIPTGKKEGYEAVRIHLAVRDYSCDELIALCRRFKKDDIVQYDIVRLMNSLKIDKNLLLYLPYAFVVAEEESEKARTIVTEVLQDCFGSTLEYREKIRPDRETMLCCIHNQQMLFYECRNKKLILVDSVHNWRSETFRRLTRYYDFNQNTIEAIIGKEHLWDRP